jgi:integrase
MASIKKRSDRAGKIVWRAYYRDPAGRQRNKSFARKVDAERYLTAIESSKLIGTYIDPSLSKLTIGIWSQRWLEGQSHLKPSTRERYAGILREHIDPKWEHVKLADVSHADVQRWVSSLTDRLSAATVRKIHRVLSLVLDLAVKDGRLVRNPATGVNLPRVVRTERRYLTHEQVELLARACAPLADPSKHRRLDERDTDAYRLIVLFLSYTGVRFGELAALRVGRLDFLRRRAAIVESVTLVNGMHTWGTPKGHERREVPIPAFLIGELATHVAGRSHDDLVFPGVRGGGALRAPVFRRAAFDRAAASIGMPGLHPHELRHTAASLAIASGADVKVVQTMLGHASAAMTLDQYGHLFGDRLDEVADAMAAARAAAVAQALPQRIVVDLDAVRREATAQ